MLFAPEALMEKNATPYRQFLSVCGPQRDGPPKKVFVLGSGLSLRGGREQKFLVV